MDAKKEMIEKNNHKLIHMTESSFKNWKFVAKLLLLILITIFLLYESTALGISPSIREVYFEPGLEKEYSFHIINNEEKNISVSISVTGEVKDYILLDDYEVELSGDETKKKVYYTLKLPEDMKPGTWKASIIAAEKTKDALSETESIISASISVASVLHIMVIPEGRYLKAELDAEDAEITGNLSFNIGLGNIGNKHISKVNAAIGIYSPDGLLIAKLNTDTIELKAYSEAQLTAVLPLSDVKDIREGEYYANAVIYYGNLAEEATDSFLIGDPHLSIINASVFNLDNNTYRFDIGLMNHWNSMIPEARVILELADKDGSIFSTIQPAPFDIEPDYYKTIMLYDDIPVDKIYGSTLYIRAVYAGMTTENKYNIEDIMSFERYEGALPSKAALWFKLKRMIISLWLRVILLMIIFVLVIRHISLLCDNMRKKKSKKRNV